MLCHKASLISNIVAASKIYHLDFGYESTLRSTDESYDKFGLGMSLGVTYPVRVYADNIRGRVY